MLVHGFPPREVAGTELYSLRLAEALAARGWRVDILAATRAPGRPHGERFEEAWSGGRVLRVVNNLPHRPLARAERDPLIEGVVHDAIRELRPRLIHVQHLLFLSAHLRLEGPAVATLHDGWGWCARGGTLLRDGAAPCPGPEPAACAHCSRDWARGSPAEHHLGRLAGALRPIVAPERLHALWRKIPASLRSRALAGLPVAEDARDAATRQAAVAAAFRRLDARVAPSRYFAELAERNGLGPTGVLPHGLAARPRLPRREEGPLVFLGSLTPHKGPGLVAKAWSMTKGLPPLEIWGPATDAACEAALPRELLRGPCPPEQVHALLSRARGLVLGSLWPENAPLVVLEARAAGCPVLAPAIGGLPELIEPGRDGLLYTPGDLASLSEQMQALVAQSWPEVAPPPTMDAHTDAVEALYHRVMG